MFTYEYDQDSDHLYVEISDSPVVSSRQITPYITQKFDARGLVVAYDIRQAAKIVWPFFAALGIDLDTEVVAA